ncbi:MAG: hypothetical protein WCE53_00020, partial [Candidatus Acidiferrum sp.]
SIQAANRRPEKQEEPDETEKASFDQAKDRRNCSFARFFSNLLGHFHVKWWRWCMTAQLR